MEIFENKLDELLRLLATSRDPELFEKDGSGRVIIEYARKSIGITIEDFYELCEILEEDKYLKIIKSQDSIGIDYEIETIKITLKGRFFIIDHGGYLQKLKNH